MVRPKRAAAGGWMYHVLNRANARTPIFLSPDDFEAFERVLEDAVARTGIRLLSYCVMGNHWHLVIWPEEDGQLSNQRNIDRGCPFGDDSWFAETARAVGLEITTRRRGRPRIHKNGS